MEHRLLIAGWINRCSIRLDARTHQVTLSGRGITRNLVDCSADLLNDPTIQGGMINGANTLGVARALCKAYGITARSAVADLGVAIPSFQVPLGETPYQIIESVARYAGFLVYEDATGALVLDRVGTTAHASGFTLPGNIEAIHAEQSVDQRYSDSLVDWFGVDQLADFGGLLNRRASEQVTILGEYRLKIIVSEQIAPSPDPALQSVANDVIAEAKWPRSPATPGAAPPGVRRRLSAPPVDGRNIILSRRARTRIILCHGYDAGVLLEKL